jgi:hypothetical protein
MNRTEKLRTVTLVARAYHSPAGFVKIDRTDEMVYNRNNYGRDLSNTMRMIKVSEYTAI